VDCCGRSNPETAHDGRQVTASGASSIRAGRDTAAAGRSIIALPSTATGGARSRVVRRLGAGARVTTPRFVADYVVTEYGVAQLKGKSDTGGRGSLVVSPTRRVRDSLAGDVATS